MSKKQNGKYTDIIEFAEVSDESLDEAVRQAVRAANSSSKLLQDIEVEKCPDTSENQPIAEPNVKIKFGYGEKRS